MRGLAVILLAGCSLATVRGPDNDRARGEPPRCTRTATLPIAVDIFLAVGGIVGGAGGIATTEGPSTGTYVGGGALIAGGLIATISAIVGYQRADVCDQEWSVFASGEGR